VSTAPEEYIGAARRCLAALFLPMECENQQLAALEADLMAAETRLEAAEEQLRTNSQHARHAHHYAHTVDFEQDSRDHQHAKRSAEYRVYVAAMRARERLRRRARDAKLQVVEPETEKAEDCAEVAGVAVAAPCVESQRVSDGQTTDSYAVGKLEAELLAAEEQLRALVLQAESHGTILPVEDEEKATEHLKRQVSPRKEFGEEEEAERWEALHEPACSAQRASHGRKNASAFPEKVLSHERWLAARGAEARAHEDNVRHREALRCAARDWKAQAAAPGDVP